MAREDIIMATPEEIKRLHVVKKVLEGGLRQVTAAEILSLSDRQVRRLAAVVRVEGDKGIVHKSRGIPSGKRFSHDFKDRAIRLYQEKYRGFGPTLASGKMFETDNIVLSDETLRKWLIESGDWIKGRRKRVHRKWRERKAYFGEMAQMDGSHHNWLEGRAPDMVLIGCIDDAANKIFGRFYEYEGTIPAMDCLKRYIKRYGLPQSIYIDRHTTYKSNAKPTIEDDLNGRKPMSRFERAMEEIGVEVIHANSPQAKGRIERLFKTLQDRLVKEMRLKSISSMEETNLFLKSYLNRHNKRFSVDAAEREEMSF